MPSAVAPIKTRFRCAHCNAVNAAPATLAGQAARCRECKKAIRVPGKRARSSKEARRQTRTRIEFRCEDCGLVKDASAKFAGKKIRCPQCGSAGRMPTRDAAIPQPKPKNKKKAKAKRAAEPEAKRDERDEDASPYAPPEAHLASHDADLDDAEFTTPIVLKIWGALIAGVQALNMALLAVAIALGAVVGVVGLGTSFVLFRMGLGLWRGEKAAVQGVGVLGALHVGLGAFVILKGGVALGLILLAQFAVLLLPPLVVGIMHYRQLK